jgi:hypothetical protein
MSDLSVIKMAIALVYDPRYLTWDSWKSLMCEAYAAQQLSINTPEGEWKQWADGLKAIDVFMNEGIPSPDGYEDWHDWASALVGAVNQSTEEA